jgi:cytochrome c-type biogenesis protein CcmH
MTYSRRAFFTAGAGLVAGAMTELAVAQAVQDSAAPAGRLFDPSRAGRPAQPVTALDSDERIQVIEKQLKCTCGCNLDVYTCRTTDFTCAQSPAMHQEVIALWEAGRTGQEIVDDFVSRHGVVILMAPPKKGFNLAAYFLPMTAILAAAAVLLLVLRRWTRGAAVAAEPAPIDPAASASPQELDRLRQELERFSG